MRQFILLLFLITFCGLLALWSPWVGASVSINELFGVEDAQEISGLYVNSLSGTIEVRIDGETQGSVDPESSPLIIDTVEPGEHLVTLTRENQSDTYWEFNDLITFTKDTNVVISYNLGPSEVFSEGNIVYATEKIEDDPRTQLTVRVNTEDAFVSLDDIPMQKINTVSFRDFISLDRQHELSISKPGFETFTFSILPSTQDERNQLEDYNVEVEVQLLQIPIELEEI